MKSARNKHLLCRDGWWYYRASLFGKTVTKALGVQELGDARKARDYYDSLYQAECIDRRLGRTPAEEAETVLSKLGVGREKEKAIATVNEILAAYRTDAAGRDIQPRTINCNALALALVVRETIGAEALEGSSAVLTWNLAHDFEASRIERAKKATPDNPEALRTALTTAASTLGQAQAVFADAAMHGKLLRSLRLPDLEGFRSFKPAGTTRKVRVPIDRPTRERLSDAVTDLWFASPDRWLAVVLCGNLGLRRGEARAARWSWVRETEEGWTMFVVTGADFAPKGTERSVVIRDDLWKDMCAVKKSEDFIIPGADDKARDHVLEQNVQFLRTMGFNMNKPTHELRALFAQTMRREHGAAAASSGLGHSDPNLLPVYAGRGTDKAVRPL